MVPSVYLTSGSESVPVSDVACWSAGCSIGIINIIRMVDSTL